MSGVIAVGAIWALSLGGALYCRRRYGIDALAWGGRRTSHPGWWWMCGNQYVRPLRTQHQHGAGTGEKHGG